MRSFKNKTSANTGEHKDTPEDNDRVKVLPSGTVALYKANPNRTGIKVVVQSLLEGDTYKCISKKFYYVRAHRDQLTVIRLGDGLPTSGRVDKLIKNARTAAWRKTKKAKATPKPKPAAAPQPEPQPATASARIQFRWDTLDNTTKIAEVPGGVVLAVAANWGALTAVFIPYTPHDRAQVPEGSQEHWDAWLDRRTIKER